MTYIFMDERGDLGFKFERDNTSTRYFLVTVLFTTNHRHIQKIVSATHNTLRKSHRKKGRTLHAYSEKSATRRRLLQKLAEHEVKIMAIYLNKSKVHTRLQEEKNVLYNYVVNILLDRIYTKKLIPLDEPINLIASRKDTNKFLNQNFSSYLSSQVKNNHKLEITINIQTPAENRCLQAVDFVSWSIFRKYEWNDKRYYDLIKEKIFEENGLFR